MMCNGKTQCLECALSSTCPSSTRVFVNYCGSMPNSLKDQINRARVDCRMRKRYMKYHGIQRSVFGENNAIVIQEDADVFRTHSFV
jgi:hypothetical protein